MAKCKQYFIDKAVLKQMCGVYVTYVPDVDKRQLLKFP